MMWVRRAKVATTRSEVGLGRQGQSEAVEQHGDIATGFGAAHEGKLMASCFTFYLGQVTSAQKHLPGAVPIAGLDHAWTFDDIGNRKTATANAQLSTYTSNLLNQYSQHTVPGAVDVMGSAQATATVMKTSGYL